MKKNGVPAARGCIRHCERSEATDAKSRADSNKVRDMPRCEGGRRLPIRHKFYLFVYNWGFNAIFAIQLI